MTAKWLVGILITSTFWVQDFEDKHAQDRFRIDPATHKITSINGETVEQTVLLTIDDTPMVDTTQLILEILSKYNVQAIFFINGYLFEDQEPMKEMVKEIHRRGHLIGNHSWSHTSFDELDSTETVQEIEKLQNKVEELVGYRPHYFRPPYGQHNDYLMDILADMNMQATNWTLMSYDWNFDETDDPDEIVELTLDQLHDGANMLFHDRKVSVKALERLLDKLIGRGYEFVLPEHP